MKYQEEKFTLDLLGETTELLEEHEEELNILSSPLNVDVKTYLQAQVQQKFVVYTAREKGEIVGYAAYFLFWHPHYRNTYVAQQDVLYLKKEFRKGLTGLKLIKYSEKELKKRSVSLILQNTKFHKSLDSLFEYMGYKESDKVYAKEL